MSNAYINKLLNDKARVSQQIIHTEQKLRSLNSTLTHLDEQIDSYENNQTKYTELNRLFYSLKPLLPDYDLEKQYLRNPVKHKYTQLGYSSKLSDQYRRQYREFVIVFHLSDTPKFIGHNLFTPAQKEIIRDYDITINEYIES